MNGIETEEMLRARMTKVDQMLQSMSLDEKLGQLLMVEFFGSDYQSTELPYMIAQQHVGGYLYQYVNHNFDAPTDTVSASKQFTVQANNDAKIPLLIAIDQEGGQVNKLGDAFYGPAPSAADMTAKGDPNNATAQGTQTAKQMQSVGINADLAPVVDVGPVANLLEDRQFSDNPQTVATYAGAFLNGLQSGGAIGCLKHFPGLGSLSRATDPHTTLPVVDESMAQLESVDFAPYKTMIQQNHPAMIMSTDVITTAIDSDLPAELSPKAIDGVLRKELAYNGVVITDGLYMGGIQQRWSIAQASVLAIIAGNDMVEGPYTASQVAGVIVALKDAIQQGQLSMDRVNQSVQRILLMKMQYGIIK
ncbi:MAG: beta-N-acetylhexosaminidase [Ktedonobacteraceae bacterium]